MTAVENSASVMTINAEATAGGAACPACYAVSTHIHSHYQRRPQDLPSSGKAIRLALTVRRFRCRNEACSRKIFCERLPGLVSVSAQRTLRLAMSLSEVALALGGEAGSRYSQRQAIAASPSSLLRLLRSYPSPVRPTPRVLGVDDFALRRGLVYGTLLVDNESHRPVDVLPERTAERFAAWLATHPGVQIITRDRANEYASAARKSAPLAIQVADRWHLLKNLSDTVLKILQQEQTILHQRLQPVAAGQSLNMLPEQMADTVQAVGPEALTPSEQRRKARLELAHQLHQKGWRQKDIAAHLRVHPKTIRRDLRKTTLILGRPRRSRRLLDPYKPYLLKRWNEGCHNAAQLAREIQTQGYTGKLTTLRSFIQRLRQASGLGPKQRKAPGRQLDSDPTQHPPSLRALAWLMVKPPDKRLLANEHLLSQLVMDHPKLTTTLSLARQFAEIVRQHQPERLDSWLGQASDSGFQVWKNFAASLQQDASAVRAALLYDWSNGTTEGHVNRLKTLKRAMYGRAKFDLLRLRVLAAV